MGRTIKFKSIYVSKLAKKDKKKSIIVTISIYRTELKPLKALTDHFGGGSRVVSFDPYS